MNIREVLRRSPFAMRMYLFVTEFIGHANDRYYRIKTESVDSFRFRTVCADATRYEAIPYWLLKRIVRIVKPGPEDIFFDIGCGKGRALALFAQFPIKKCVGIEIDPGLGQVAEQNAASLRGHVAPIDIRVENAVDTDYCSGTIYFLFNPFGAATLSAVLVKIKASLDKRPRKICVVYYNPLHLDLLRTVLGLEVSLRTEGHFPWRPQKVAIAYNHSAAERGA
jgi:SAM-dependent methyltransferase